MAQPSQVPSGESMLRRWPASQTTSTIGVQIRGLEHAANQAGWTSMAVVPGTKRKFPHLKFLYMGLIYCNILKICRSGFPSLKKILSAIY